MDNLLVAKSVYIGLLSFGIKITKTVHTEKGDDIYISVPETSYHYNAKNEQMAGAVLAQRFKEMLKDFNIPFNNVLFKIRKGEHWTEADKEWTINEMKSSLF